MHARKAAQSLQAYAEALYELTNSKSPQDLAMSFSGASEALAGLKASTDSLSPGSGMSERASTLFQTGSGLIATLLGEAYEARRYRLIGELVRESDPLVETASRVIATWFFAGEKDSIQEAYAMLEEIAPMSHASAAAGMEGQAQLLDELHGSYTAVQNSELYASWRPYIGIAQAHRAILESFNAPASLDELLEANDRVSNLVDQVRMFSMATKVEEEEIF